MKKSSVWIYTFHHALESLWLLSFLQIPIYWRKIIHHSWLFATIQSCRESCKVEALSLLSYHEYYCSCCCQSLKETLCWVTMNITVLVVVSLWKKFSAELPWILLSLLLSVSNRNSLLSYHEYYCSCCCQSLNETLCWVGMNITVLVVVSLWEKLSAELAWL